MNIKNEFVWHKVWGQGKILKYDERFVEIRFGIGDKKLQFPEAFEQFLIFEKKELQNYILDLLEKKRTRERKSEQELRDALRCNRDEKLKRNHRKEIEKSSIAFKCNFCDGGCDANTIGYKGVCSDEIICYNVEVARHRWCCNQQAPCFQYYNGELTRQELEDIMGEGVKDAGFVCYESQMLINWKAFAGYALTKENFQKPMTLPKVRTNSLCVLTTRLPGLKEKDRFIFAVFLVDETFEGDNRSEGYVTTSSKYKLHFSLEEAQKLKFWNYYCNNNRPELISWGQGLHRYIDDVQAAQILRDITSLKRGTEEESIATEFYRYFLEINGFEENRIPKNKGALQT